MPVCPFSVSAQTTIPSEPLSAPPYVLSVLLDFLPPASPRPQGRAPSVRFSRLFSSTPHFQYFGNIVRLLLSQYPSLSFHPISQFPYQGQQMSAQASPPA